MNYLDILQIGVIAGTVITGYFALRYYGLFRDTVFEEQAAHNANQISEHPALEKKPLMTGNEREFYGRVKAAADALRLRVHSQVSMAALVQPTVDESSPHFQNIRQQYAMKIIDFVLEYKGESVLVIELDDKTHNKAKDEKRDILLANAGIKTLRYESVAKPTVEQLTSDIRRTIADRLTSF